MGGSLGHIPGSLGPPVVGQTFQFLRDARGMVAQNQARWGDTFKGRVLGQDSVIFLSPDATRTIYLDREQNFSSEIGWSFTIGPMFRHGLMLRDFQDHRLHRRAMQHAFRRAALAGYMTRIHEVTDRRLERWERGEVSVYEEMKALTLDIAGEVFLGLTLGDRLTTVNEAFVAMMKASITPLRKDLPGTAFRAGLRGRVELERLFGELVDARSREPEGQDLLSRLCHAPGDDGEPLSRQDIVDHMIFLLLAAHDTTTSTLSVMLWALATEPHWQDDVVEEVRGIHGADVTLDNHGRLEATGRVMKEALRLNPPVPFSPRGVLRDCEIDGVTIPAGTMITAASLMVHRHPGWWTDPDRFDPDRFTPSRAEDKQHSHLYVPFGGGAHICIGNHFAELITKAIVARLLAGHRLASRPGDTLRMRAVPIPKPRGNLILSVSTSA